MSSNESPSPLKPNDTKFDWEGLAQVICQSPEKEKYLEMMLVHIHNLRQSVSVISAVEALMRRMIVEDRLNNPLELLNALQIAYQRMLNGVEEISNAFDPFDK